MQSRKIKTAIVILISIPCAVVANPNLYAPNVDGGELVLTQSVGCENKKLAYYTFEDKTVMYGCWMMLDERIHIEYTNAVKHVLELTIFKNKKNKYESKSQVQSFAETAGGAASSQVFRLPN